MPLYRAYMIAYQVAVDTNAVRVKASRLRSNPKIDERIVNIQREVAAKHKWSLDTVVGELTFVHDAAKADIIMDGLRKANSDAMLNSLDRITSLLHISDEGRRAQAEADVAKIKADELQGKGEDNPILLAMAKQAQQLVNKEEEDKE
ncbi:MAG: terminase [Pediococcus acidilactici]|uniref:hypothetical protein n=1 Tax=Pediococcus acidilactici TaxID=1254 RepID=UPI0003271585|nr:hypothetical protein [Pediococcus acidilactici]EOA09240.1 prophage terminase small subunit [Pediococcus acidilactici D3]GEB25609.1 hypothetical protein PAC01_06010 [Pediococcus acidilactici]